MSLAIGAFLLTSLFALGLLTIAGVIGEGPRPTKVGITLLPDGRPAVVAKVCRDDSLGTVEFRTKVGGTLIWRAHKLGGPQQIVVPIDREVWASPVTVEGF